MKKIKLFPAPHLELRIFVSDQMEKDYKECARMAEAADCEGKECDSCSWKDVRIETVGMCELEEMKQLIGGNDGEINAPAQQRD